jgi:hypothetical protein
MPQIPFSDLPEPARLWIFASDRPLSPVERASLEQAVERGLSDWAAHGSPVTWGMEVVAQQFLFLGVDESRTALTGCSIDKAIHEVQDLERHLGLDLLDHGRIFYREGEMYRVVSRDTFRELAQSRAVNGDTVVLNNVISTVGEYRRGLWEVPVRRSWHAQAFPAGV